MNQIVKVSEVTSTDLAAFLRVGEVTPYEEGFLNTIIGAATAYMCKYTGLTSEQLDESQDFVQVLLVLCQDMYDNRALYVDSANVNRMVQSILDMHSVNLLPSAVKQDD
nr:MAG TPA: head tail connector [Caudoviricetes sp.]